MGKLTVYLHILSLEMFGQRKISSLTSVIMGVTSACLKYGGKI
jgi:hypothetical protein